MTTPEEQQGPTVRHPDEVGTAIHVEPKKKAEVKEEKEETKAPTKIQTKVSEK